MNGIPWLTLVVFLPLAGTAALLLAGALAALMAVRLTGRVPSARAEIGRFKSEELEPATRARPRFRWRAEGRA